MSDLASLASFLAFTLILTVSCYECPRSRLNWESGCQHRSEVLGTKFVIICIDKLEAFSSI